MEYIFEKTALVPKDNVRARVDALAAYGAKLKAQVNERDYDVPEAALTVPFDEQHLAKAEAVARAVGHARHVVLIGIGGSSVGTEALYGALKTEATPTLTVLDMMDERKMREVLALCESVALADIAVVVISKSGSTTETLVNADIVLTALKNRHGDEAYRRVICIGDPDTKLHTYAKERGIAYAAMPKEVGGRYSVFTTVGLVPALLLGFDAEALLRGARESIDRSLGEVAENAGAFSAAVLATHLESGMHTHVLFSEDARLDNLMRWYQQLFAESLGKTETKNGSQVRIGAAPLVATPRELHATAQLYLSGFPGTFTTFVGIETSKSAYEIGTIETGAQTTIIGDRSYSRIPEAIMAGVHAAYVEAKLPYARTSLVRVDAETMGAYMAERMLEVMFIATAFDINAFDQPHVELYKKETRRILESNGE